jgi:hypothetical protein
MLKLSKLLPNYRCATNHFSSIFQNRMAAIENRVFFN